MDVKTECNCKDYQPSYGANTHTSSRHKIFLDKSHTLLIGSVVTDKVHSDGIRIFLTIGRVSNMVGFKEELMER